MIKSKKLILNLHLNKVKEAERNIEFKMKNHYDFSKAKKNPYTKLLKKQITINLSEEVLDYFKEMSSLTSIPYQTLINFYLLDCVKNKKSIDISWND